MCQKYGLVNSTIQKICVSRTKIINAFENSGSRIKRCGKAERSDVEETLLKRFKHDRSGNVPVSGSLVMTTFVLTQFQFQVSSVNRYKNLQKRKVIFIVYINCNLNLKLTLSLTLSKMQKACILS